MEQIKSSCDETKFEDFSQKLKVCGHPIRLKILCLIEMQSSCVSDLWQCLNQPQPVVSQHLAVLKDKGIVGASVDGNRRIYTITDSFIRSLIKSIDL